MSAPILTCETPAAFEAAIQQAFKLIKNDKLVVLPTETVYGIAARLTLRTTVEEIAALKHMKEPFNWVLHVADISAAERLNAHIPPVALRIMRRAWPGPVAVEVPFSVEDRRKLVPLVGATTANELTPEKFISFRCPENAITRAVLAKLKEPVVIVGAGRGSSVHSADAVPRQIAEAVAAIVDDGPTRYRKASTVVRVEGDKVQVRQVGVIDARIIYRMADMLILFVCTGNTCRSPMAAGFASQFLAKKLSVRPQDLADHHLQVLSAGVSASTGMPAAADAIAAAGDLGADIANHASQPATAELLRRADVIYTMTRGHRKEILEMNPSAADKTFTLDPDGDISDPIGTGRENYQKIAKRIFDLIAQRLDGIEL